MDANEYFSLLIKRKIPFVIDDERWRDFLVAHGFPVVHFDDGDFLSAKEEPSFTLITRLDYHARLMERWSEARNVSSHLALAKFDTSPRGIEYTLTQFLSVDFRSTLARRAQYYDALLSCQDTEIVTGAGVLRAGFRDALEVANSDLEMQPGWLYSVAEFFETSVVNLEADRSSFCLNGDFGFDGLIYLCNKEELKGAVGAKLDELIRLSTAGGNVVRFADNQIEQLVIGGQDQTALLRELTTGRERESAATELAVGCVEFPLPQDWSINSVMHESTHGVHVGIGMGGEVPHMDFISKGAELRYLGQSGT